MKELETIQSRFDLAAFDKIEFPMIITDYEKDQAIYHAAFLELDKMKFRGLSVSGFSLASDVEVMKVVEYYKIDIEKVVDYANRMKTIEVEQNKQIQKEIEDEAKRDAERKDFWSAGEIYRLMYKNAAEATKSGLGLIYDDENAGAIESICYFLSNDPKFETKMGFDKTKGIILMGSYGTGKSFIPRMAKDNGLNPIDIYSLVKIEHDVRNSGTFSLNLSERRIINLDDVGAEKEVQTHYGNKINWFQEWIELMYSENRPFNRLILSTNLDSNEIEQRYGGRVRSRLTEKMNIILLNGKDRRKG